MNAQVMLLTSCKRRVWKTLKEIEMFYITIISTATHFKTCLFQSLNIAKAIKTDNLSAILGVCKLYHINQFIENKK